MASAPEGKVAPGRIAATVQRWLRRRGSEVPEDGQTGARATPAGPDLNWGEDWLSEPLSLDVMTGTPQRPLRSRRQIYSKWQDMLADPVITSALRLHCTAALGGHETRGDMIFIEPSANVAGQADAEKLVKEIKADLEALFNRIAPVVCFNSVAFGDGYGRMFAKQGVGVVDVYVDEMVLPPLVQPYERGNITVGYMVASGTKFREKMTVLQLARMRLPRLMYVPQERVVEKFIRMALKTDNVEDMPAVPSLAGGSFLDGAEIAYDKFAASWAGLTGQRVQDSIDETLLAVNLSGTTPQQRKTFLASFKAMIESSNAYINKVVEGGRSVYGRVFHVLPTANEKQVAEVRSQMSNGRTASLTIDDVMMNAKLLAGALGLDMAMLGFGDLLSGGLGEGGFFRLSAQAGERSRMIRSALSEFLEHVIAVHLLYKKGIEVDPKNKPWVINYASGISALETERAKTKADNMNSAALMVQTMQQIKDLGLDEGSIAHLLETQMGLDTEDAKKYAAALAKAIKAAKEAEQNAGGFGGGMGGGMMPGGPAEDEPVVPAEG